MKLKENSVKCRTFIDNIYMYVNTSHFYQDANLVPWHMLAIYTVYGQ